MGDFGRGTRLHQELAGQPNAVGPSPGKSTLTDHADDPAMAEHTSPRLELRPSEGGYGGAHSHTDSTASTRAAAGAIHHAVAAIAPGDPSPARTTVGVGEEVSFSDSGAGDWQASAGTGATTSPTTYTWHAPDVAGPVTITRGAHSVAMTVVAPDRIDFRKTEDDPQRPAGVGMVTNLTFGPNNVSFANAEWLEVPSEAINVTGYFDDYRRRTGQDLFHHPATDWIPMGSHNNGVDDHAFTHSKPGPYSPGSYEWDIPNKYRVIGQPNQGYPFAKSIQRFTMDAAGRMTVTKGGQTAAQVLTGVTEGTQLRRFATVADAVDMFNSEVGGPIAGLRYLPNTRDRDPGSYRNLVAALRAMTLPQLHVSLRCLNSYSWIEDDSVTLAVTGNRAAVSNALTIDTGQTRSVQISFLDLFDPEHWTAQASLTFVATTGSHTMRASMVYPFTSLNHSTALDGSDGRYSITAFIPTSV
jgi:hypothetical protein